MKTKDVLQAKRIEQLENALLSKNEEIARLEASLKNQKAISAQFLREKDNAEKQLFALSKPERRIARQALYQKRDAKPNSHALFSWEKSLRKYDKAEEAPKPVWRPAGPCR